MVRAVFLTLVLLAGGVVGATAQEDLLVADFEGRTYGDWQATGEAFGPGPARGTLPDQMPVSGFEGRGLVNSFFRGDETTGTLTSPEFRIERRYLHFLIGGGNHPGETCVNLLLDGQIARTATGPNSEFLRWRTWDVVPLKGKTARIQIVDRHTGGWGHINVDHIIQSDTTRETTDDRDTAISHAMASVRQAAEQAAKDPARPVYHFRAPGNWINDPNGPIFWNGYYHLFYQHNPYGDKWGHMHWGHARSKDLVHWEHLPIALWPSLVRGEEHCFSGCAALNARGRPMLFYTSIGHEVPECWAAVPEDEDLLRWKKHPENPILTARSGGVTLHEWRDPFVFRADGETFMVHGGNLNASKGGQAAVSLYRAKNGELTQWEYLGILFQHPDPKVANVECPNFFRLGEEWLLITSPHRQSDYFIGSFDPGAGKFTAKRQGLMDHSGSFYAPNCLEDSKRRRILWGWVRGFPEGRGWNGCMTLPRVLSIGSDGSLLQQPAPELKKLRGKERRIKDLRLDDRSHLVPDLTGDTLEILAELEPGDAKTMGLKLRRSADGSRAVTVQWDGQALDVAGTRVPVRLGGRKTLKLQVFLDKSVMEVYVDGGRECVTRVLSSPTEDQGVEVFATGGTARVKTLQAWPVKPIW
jgi:sucrose-6-phosphate hydrolase SacC (GH32 family)